MVQALKKFFKIDGFLSNVFLPLIVLLLYCASFAYLSSILQLEGVTYVFVTRLARYLVLAFPVVSVGLVAVVWANRGSLGFQRKREPFYRSDLLLLLLPLTPIVQYLLINRAIMSVGSSLYLVGIFILFSAAYIFLVPLLLSKVISSHTVLILGLAFVYMIASMALFADNYAWFEKGSLKTQLAIFAGVFAVTWLFYGLGQRKALYLFIVINLTVNSFVQLSNSQKEEANSSAVAESELLVRARKKTPVVTPNIYLLVYDAYVPNETMLSYGIDNSAQEQYLREQGFKLYPHAYSIGSTTLSTMSRVLNVSNVYENDKRVGVSGDGVVQTLLKGLDYKTYGLFASDYMFRGYGSYYDVSVPEQTTLPYVQLLKAILMGEFRFDIENVGFDKQNHDAYVTTKREVFQELAGNRVFVYMHTNLPTHSQNSGTCLSNETTLFAERLARANIEMRDDLKIILERDPGAIVIIAGDHGPYLTKNCDWTFGKYDMSEISRLDVQDRFGTFLAIRWPSQDYEEYDDITVLQDVFPAVFAYLYKDASILETKVQPVIPRADAISGVSVDDGLILGGIDDGEPLFLSTK